MTARVSPEREAEIPFGHRSALKGAIANTLAEHRDSADAAAMIAKAVQETLVQLGYAELTAVRADAQRALDLLMSGNGYEAALLLDSITGTEVAS